MYPLPQAALEQHIALLGKTGSGKTSTGKLIVEQVFGADFRVCILDPIKSDWWGITSSADGRSPGLPFTILGGPRGHLPLHSGAGHAIGELVAGGNLPLSILDMAHFEAGGHARFFCDFAETLHRKMTGVLYLVMEEAHEFAPKERAGVGRENMALYHAKRLATAGRSKGIRLILATQRTQSLHNALLGSCETMIVHRLTAPADQLPVKKWLAANAPKNSKHDVEASLSSLKTGTAWVCSGELGLFDRTEFPRIQTFDNSATPTKDSKRVKVKTADVDVDAIRKLVGTAVDEAEARDPDKLLERIAELEKALKAKPSTAGPSCPACGTRHETSEEVIACYGDAAKIQGLETRVAELEHNIRIRNSELNKRRDFVREIGAVMSPLVSQFDDLGRMHARIGLSDWPDAGDPAIMSEPASKPNGSSPPPARPRPSDDTLAGENLHKIHAAILRALYWLRDEDATPAKVAFYSGYSAKSSSTGIALKDLRASGLVDGWRPTAAGAARIAAEAGEKPTGPELISWLKPKLSDVETAVLDVLASCGGPLTAEIIAHRAGYSATSSTFTGALASLRRIGAVKGSDRTGGARIAEAFR